MSTAARTAVMSRWLRASVLCALLAWLRPSRPGAVNVRPPCYDHLMMTYMIDTLPSPIYVVPCDMDYFAEVTDRIAWSESEGYWVEDYLA